MNPAGGSRQEKERYSREHWRNPDEEVARPLVEASRIPSVPHEAVPAGHGIEGEDLFALDPVKEEEAHDRMAQLVERHAYRGRNKVRPAAERTQKEPASRPVEKIAENRHGKDGNTGNKEFIKSECDKVRHHI